MEVCKKLFEVNTILTADSVEWCPVEGLKQLLACGTYQLEKDGVRRGSLSLHEWNNSTEKAKLVLAEETKQLSGGILDAKWSCLEGKATLALAESSGVVNVLQIGKADCESYSLCGFGSVDAACKRDGKQGLCLSLDWSSQLSPGVLAVSDSLGCISMVELTSSGLRYLHGWKAHDFEAWIVAFGSSPHTVFSGGDDCKLHMWDTRMGFMKPTFTSKRYEMGVCSLQRHPTEEHVLASGSYDESVVLWDVRTMARPLKEISLGGGVWRIKWHPKNPNLIATACMHNGCSVVDAHLDSGERMELLCCYKEHNSLAYGIDWSRLEGHDSAKSLKGRDSDKSLEGHDSAKSLKGRDSAKSLKGHDSAKSLKGRDSDKSLEGRGSAKRPQDCAKLLEDHLLASCSFYDHSLHFWTVSLI